MTDLLKGEEMTCDPDVHDGINGWKFLVGGTNEVIKFYTTPNFFDDEKKQLWLDLLRDRYNRAKSIGARYCHVIAPEKISVYPEYFGRELPYLSESPSRSLRKHELNSEGVNTLVDVIAALELAKANGRDLYFKTDTHWTPEAADVVASAVCKMLGVPYGDNFKAREISYADLILDLGGKCNPPINERWHMRLPSGRLTPKHKNKMVVFKEENGLENEGGLHVGSAISYINSSPHVNARIVVFGDSFSEYRDHSLCGALAENFRETHFVWSAQLDWEYIASLKPDYIVSELAERFMNVVPSADINLTSFVESRLEAFKSTHSAN